MCGGGYVRRWVCGEVGGDMWRWVSGCGVDVVCLLSPFQSSLQSSRTVTADPHSIPHYKQGKVTFLIISTH